MKIVILLYKGFTALDVTGAYEILSRLPGAEVKFASKEKGIIEGEYAGMKMVAGYRLDEINDVDILLIPGSTYAFMEVVKDAEILQQIRRIHEVT
ncbi:MAG: DJ-1/PfpI family protein, partial [Ginsengibacter sp.]